MNCIFFISEQVSVNNSHQISRKRPTLCLALFLAGCYCANMRRVLGSVIKNAVRILAVTACPARLLIKPFQRFLKDRMISSTRGQLANTTDGYLRWQFSVNRKKEAVQRFAYRVVQYKPYISFVDPKAKRWTSWKHKSASSV